MSIYNLSDDEYAEVQKYLANNPSVGDVIQQTGGLRKIRWSSQGKVNEVV